MIFSLLLFGMFTVSSSERDYDGKYNYLLTNEDSHNKIYSVEFRSNEVIDVSNIKYVRAECFNVWAIDEAESKSKEFFVTRINYLCSMKEIAWKTTM